MHLRQDWYRKPPSQTEEILSVLNFRSNHLNDQSPEGEVLRSLYTEIKEQSTQLSEEARRQSPISFVTLSYEQVLKCNAWIHGITYVVDFDANRKGKTACAIFNALLYILPNDPEWIMFRPYTDDWGRHVQLYQRPSMSCILEIQQVLKANPSLQSDPRLQPYEGENAAKFALLQKTYPHLFTPCFPAPSHTSRLNTIWQGAPDHPYSKEIIMPEWRKWLPKDTIERDSTYDSALDLKIQWVEHTITKTARWKLIFKSYDAKEEKFSGSAVRAILLTEGVRFSHFNEIRQRFQEDAWASWDYTPYEARNTGAKTNLAWKVFKGKERLPLKPFVFTGFGIDKTPSFILPESKKQDLMAMWAGKPEGKARIEGKFYTNTPIALTNLDPEFHALPWTFQQLNEQYKSLRLFRGLDPGWDHPTACVWGALNQNNVWFIYRVYSEAGKSLGKRCGDIIHLSNNTRQKIYFGRGEEDFYFEEVHSNPNSEVIVATIADYHTFKTDETTQRPYSTNYVREGLVITPSATLGPKQRAALLDQKLEPSLLRAHPIRKIPPGSKIYFLINEPGVALAMEKLENFFWSRYVAGEKQGTPKDELQDHDDDEFDALSYLICSPFIWTPEKPIRKDAAEVSHNRSKSIVTRAMKQPNFAITNY